MCQNKRITAMRNIGNEKQPIKKTKRTIDKRK